MKKCILITIFAAIAALCSCQKQSVEAPAGKTITIKASIAETKANASMGESGIDFSWGENESIFVYCYDFSNHFLKKEVFTSTNAAGAKKIDFTGTISNAATAKMICVYLDNPSSSFYTQETEYIHLNNSNFPAQQTSNTDATPIKEAMLLIGEATEESGTLSVTLAHATTSLSCKINVASKLSSVSEVRIKGSEDYSFGMGSCSAYSIFNNGIWLGNNYGRGGFVYPVTLTPEEGYVTLNVPLLFNSGYRSNEMESGQSWTFEITGLDSGTPKTYTTTKTFNSAFTLLPGVCYKMNIAAEDLALVE